ncbi:AAA family ATPase, partial [archaeon]|nr:AAA family ATPase [archaeon]
MISNMLWGEIIKDFQEKKMPELVEREIHYPLEPPIKRAVVLVGPRRAGKTYLMFKAIKDLLSKGIEKKCILYVNFEDTRLTGASVLDLNNLLNVFFEIFPENKSKKIWFFLDEIQVIEHWEKFVRMLLDMDNFHVFVTGSSSKLMSREIATSLRGRNLTYDVFPFSFVEYLKAYKITSKKYLSTMERSKIIKNLDEYIVHGGYPETVIYRHEFEKILREILDVTIYRDVVERHKVKNVKLLKIFFTARSEERR